MFNKYLIFKSLAIITLIVLAVIFVASGGLVDLFHALTGIIVNGLIAIMPLIFLLGILWLIIGRSFRR